MQRRQFLASTLATSALAFARAEAQTPAAATATASPQYLELRKYQLSSGPQSKLTQTYFASSLIPALNRMGITPIGAFSLTFGSETPALYLLLPSPSLETLVLAQQRLAADDTYTAAAAAFWSAPYTAPPFIRVESQLLRAFAGYPAITPPAAKAKNRVFQLRTYESATDLDHARKVEMFGKGEFGFFAAAGIDDIFFADTLIGPRMPSLTYMLGFNDITEVDPKWALFNNNPDWKKLNTVQRYNFEPTVSNVDNLILKPLACSQI